MLLLLNHMVALPVVLMVVAVADMEEVVVDMAVVVTAAEEVAMEILPVANPLGGKHKHNPLFSHFLFTHFASTPGRRPTWGNLLQREIEESTLDWSF